MFSVSMVTGWRSSDMCVMGILCSRLLVVSSGLTTRYASRLSSSAK